MVAPELPALALARIVESLDGSLRQIATFAGVCSSWRAAARDAALPHLTLNSVEKRAAGHAAEHVALSGRLQRVQLPARAAFFEAAARLPRRHRGFTCVGEAVGDAVVEALAQPHVEVVVLKGSSSITDAGLEAVVTRCPQLRRLHLEDLPAVRGAFLPSLLACCAALESLRLVGLPRLQWAHLPASACGRLPALSALSLKGVALPDCDSEHIFERLPALRSLSLGSHPPAVWAAARHCPLLEEVSLLAGTPEETDGCLAALLSARSLRVLELCSTAASLTAGQLRLAGLLNLRELRLESRAFRLQPLSRLDYGHVDNAGVRALVDAVCARCMFQSGWQPFELSLRGAAGLTHDAVSSLLRLPLLSGLLLEGCHRISALDRMRLVAKVKAGRGLLGSGRRPQPQPQPPAVLVGLRA